MKNLLYLFIFLFLSLATVAQVGISNANITPDPSSILELKSTTAGFLSPRMTTVQRDAIASPATGLIIYNTTINQFNYFDGTSWQIIGGGKGWALKGNSGTTVGIDFLGTIDARDFTIYTNNAERIRVQSGGNVGIGTASPQRLFHVSQNNIGTPSMFALENSNTNDGNGMSLSFRGTTTGVGAVSFNEFSSIQSIFESHNYPTKASSLIFHTSARGYISERMRISATGHIGIGNQTPSNALHVTDAANPLRLEGLVKGDITDQILTVDANGVVRQQTSASISSLDSWSKLGNSGTTAGTNFIGTTDAQDFAIYTNNAEKIRVQSGGNVGIGTASPQRLFHVSQNDIGTPSMFALDNPNTTNGNGISLSFRGTTTGAGGSSFNEFATIQASYSTHDKATSASSMRFFTSAAGSNKERMRISVDGFVGIGTKVPSNALHIFALSNPLRLEGLEPSAGTDQILTVDATGVVRQQTAASLSSSNSWSQLGNTGTHDGTNFVGTTDNVPFNIRVNNQKAGRIDNTANGLVAFGYQSLNANDNTTGLHNTAIGYQSLSQNIVGPNNTAVGYRALANFNAGYARNTAIGSQSLANTTTGIDNTATGSASLFSNTTGVNNTATGSSALNKNTSGNFNTANGTSALLNNTTGTQNTAIGQQALMSNIGGGGNTATGFMALHANTASNNTAIGFQSLRDNTTGTNNTATGYASLISNIGGSGNTATGNASLEYNSGGINNTAIGFQSLSGNTTGNYNTATGGYAMDLNITGSNNTAIGHASLLYNTAGSSNTATGFQALNITTGSSNAAYGDRAGLANTTGNKNTFIGAQSNASSADLTNATAIGYNAKAGASNTMVLGAIDSEQVFVGVGITTPKSYLDINGSLGTAIITTATSITLNQTHYTVIVTGGTISLPAAGTENHRRSYRIINRTTSVITIGSFIDFTGLPVSTVPAHSKIEIQSDGTNWHRVD